MRQYQGRWYCCLLVVVASLPRLAGVCGLLATPLLLSYQAVVNME